MNFFELLILSRKMEFKDNGEVTLYGQDIVVLPDALMVEYLLELDDDSDSKKMIYSTAKEAMLEHKANIMKAYQTSGSPSWICNTVNLLGQGKIKYENDANVGPIGNILVENSPTARDLKGKAKAQTEHVLRGIIAGIVSAVSEKDIDAIEIECVATGSALCKFVLGPKQNLKDNFAKLCSEQLVV